MAQEISITATEANRRFSELLRGARAGKRYTITSHGRAVARLMPGDDGGVEAKRRARARRELLEHLRTRKPLRVEPWTRGELYDR
jgi:prevent-host-death family protein